MPKCSHPWDIDEQGYQPHEQRTAILHVSNQSIIAEHFLNRFYELQDPPIATAHRHRQTRV